MDPAGVIRREAAGRDNTMKMGMVQQILAPGVEDGEETNLGSEMSGFSADLEQGFAAAARANNKPTALVSRLKEYA